MKKDINLNEFIDEFKRMDRDYFSYEGYEMLFNYYDEIEDFELDVIAICSDITEYTAEELIKDYGYLYPINEYKEDNIKETEEEDLEEEYLDELLKILDNKTTIIRLNNSFLVFEY